MGTNATVLLPYHNKNYNNCVHLQLPPDGAVVMSSANGLVGTGFASRYQLQPRAGVLKTQWVGVWPLHPLLSH